MENNVIAFVGCEKYDLILYLSRVLFHLGKKVLLIDCTESEELYQCVPAPLILREECGYIDYGGTEFGKSNGKDTYNFSAYDLVLMNFSFQMEEALVPFVRKICYVTDLQLHHIRQLNSIRNYDCIEQCLIIKDTLPCKIHPDYIIHQIYKHIDQNQVYLFNQDNSDYKYKIENQYNHKIIFPKLSKEVQSFIKNIILQFYPEIGDKQYSIAYKNAERGR